MQAQLTDDEVAYIKRAPTDDEYATTGGMPQLVARGWLIRKRCQELAMRRGNEKLAAVFEAVAGALREQE